MFPPHQDLSSRQKALIGRIEDKLIQDLLKFPNLSGRGTNQFFSFQDYLLENGRAVELLPVRASTMPARSCYANAEAVALRYPADMFYMEGYAAWEDPATNEVQIFQHAWIFSSTQAICLDPTFRHPGVVAIGCVFPVRSPVSVLPVLKDAAPSEYDLLLEEVARSVHLYPHSTIGIIHALCSTRNASAAHVFSEDVLRITRPIRYNPTHPENEERKAQKDNTK
jgi:hypothetical protein